MHSPRFQQRSKVGNGRQECGDAPYVEGRRAESEAPLAVALRGDSRNWLRLALEQAERDPLGVALDAAALWEVLRERAVRYLEREQAGRD